MKIRKYWMVYLAAVLLVIVAIVQDRAAGSPQYIPPVKYGQQFTFYFNVFSSSDPNRFYATAPASADVHIIKDGGAAENPTNSITDLGKTFSLVLTATEMQAAVVIVEVNDATAAAAYMDESWAIPTYGNTSALNAFDLDDATPPADVTLWTGETIPDTNITGVPEVSVTYWRNSLVAVPTTAGVPEIDVTYWLGTAAATPNTAGYPVVTIKDGTGTGEINTSSGVVLAADQNGVGLATHAEVDTVEGTLASIIEDTGTTLDNLVDDLETRIPDILPFVNGNLNVDINSVDGNDAAAANMLVVYGSSNFLHDFNSNSKMWNGDVYYVRGETPGDYDTLLDANENQMAATAAVQSTVDTIEGYVDTEIATIQTTVDGIDANGTLTLADTNELQTNQGNWLTATGFATTADIAAVLADTNELQTNQGNWLTATGFATTAEIAALQATVNDINDTVVSVKVVTDLLPDAGALTSLALHTDVNEAIAAAGLALHTDVNEALAASDILTQAQADVNFIAMTSLIVDANTNVETEIASVGTLVTDANTNLKTEIAAVSTLIADANDNILAAVDTIEVALTQDDINDIAYATAAAVGGAVAETVWEDPNAVSATIIAGIDANITAAIATIGAAGAGLTALPWNAAWDPNVQAEATNAIASAALATAANLATLQTTANGIDANVALTLEDTAAWDTATEAKIILFGKDANGLTMEDSIPTELASADVDRIQEAIDANSDQLAAIKTLVTDSNTTASAVKVVTDKLVTAIELDGAVYRFTENALEEAPSAIIDANVTVDANDIVDTLFARTGVTAGGTWTFQKLLQVAAAWLVGNWQDDPNTDGTYQILDPDDGTTVMLELVPSETSPQKTVTVP
jgi:hypothetical protein